LRLGITKQVVNERSGSIDGASNLFLPADHFNINKYTGPDDPCYRIVLPRLKEMAGQRIPWGSATQRTAAEVEFLRCLNKSDYLSNRRIVPRWTDGTCQWVLKDKNYQLWLCENSSSILWIPGDPGCGKSVLASFLVDELRSSKSQASLYGTVCYFFFKDGDSSQQGAVGAISALLYQLFTAPGNENLLSDTVRDICDRGEVLAEATNTLQNLWDILRKVTRDQNCGNIIFIIDGVDECEDRRDLMEEVVRHFNKESTKEKAFLKMIVTGRPYGPLEARFREVRAIRLNLEEKSDAISSDVRLVARAEAARLRLMCNISPTLERKITQRLISMADQSFLWIQLVLIEIQARIDSGEFYGRESEFDEIISTTNLDEVYENLLNRASKKYPEMARKILSIVVTAARPLTVTEMNLAISIRTGNKSDHNLKDTLPNPEVAIKNICGLLVRIIDSKVYLIHQTARTFLIKRDDVHKSIDRPWKHSIDLVKFNGTFAEICISYLSLPVFESHPMFIPAEIENAELNKIVSNYVSDHGFLAYAAKNWTYHYRAVKEQVDYRLLESALQLFNTRSKRFLNWFQVSWTEEKRAGLCPQDFTDLMAIAFSGLPSLVRLLVDKGVDIEATTTAGQTALEMLASGAIATSIGGASVARELYLAGAKFSPTKGIVQWINHYKKYGFVLGKDGQKSLFFHKDIVDGDVFNSLSCDEFVMFGAARGAKGPEIFALRKVSE
jgi:cold shock CspA family protein